MKIRLVALSALAISVVSLAGCARKETPFLPTAVPQDFAIIVDDNVDNYYSRQHVEQVVTAQDMMSTTTYRSYRDFNNTLSSSFKQEQPLTQSQLQAMWNEVARNNLLAGGRMWVNWLSEADIYRHKEHTVQIRANGQVKTYRAENGARPQMRDLMLLVDSVRLPSGQKGAAVVGRPAATPAEGAPAMELPPVPLPTQTPATAPEKAPAATPGPDTD